jgi:hypothetical protein
MLAIALTLADTALKLVLPALLAWIGAKSVKWVSAKTGNQEYQDAITRLLDVAKIVVAELEQTIVKELRTAAEDGVVTPSELARVKDMAVDRMQQYIGGEKGMADIGAKLKMDRNSLVAFLGSIIESIVYAAKLGTQAPVLPAFLDGPGVQSPPVPLPIKLPPTN